MSYDVVLESVGRMPVLIVKTVVELTDLDVESGRALVDRAPIPVLSGVDESTADRAVIALRNNGAIVTRRAS